MNIHPNLIDGAPYFFRVGSMANPVGNGNMVHSEWIHFFNSLEICEHDGYLVQGDEGDFRKSSED